MKILALWMVSVSVFCVEMMRAQTYSYHQVKYKFSVPMLCFRFVENSSRHELLLNDLTEDRYLREL